MTKIGFTLRTCINGTIGSQVPSWFAWSVHLNPLNFRLVNWYEVIVDLVKKVVKFRCLVYPWTGIHNKTDDTLPVKLSTSRKETPHHETLIIQWNISLSSDRIFVPQIVPYLPDRPRAAVGAARIAKATFSLFSAFTFDSKTFLFHLSDSKLIIALFTLNSLLFSFFRRNKILYTMGPPTPVPLIT